MAETKYTTIEWIANTKPLREKNDDWYWTVGMIGVFLALAAFISGNWLFGLLILLADMIIIMRNTHEIYNFKCTITTRGVLVGHELYPYSIIKYFSLNTESVKPSLVLNIMRPIIPTIHIPLPPNIDTENIRVYLAKHIKQKAHKHSLSDAIAEYLDI